MTIQWEQTQLFIVCTLPRNNNYWFRLVCRDKKARDREETTHGENVTVAAPFKASLLTTKEKTTFEALVFLRLQRHIKEHCRQTDAPLELGSNCTLCKHTLGSSCYQSDPTSRKSKETFVLTSTGTGTGSTNGRHGKALGRSPALHPRKQTAKGNMEEGRESQREAAEVSKCGVTWSSNRGVTRSPNHGVTDLKT